MNFKQAPTAVGDSLVALTQNRRRGDKIVTIFESRSQVDHKTQSDLTFVHLFCIMQQNLSPKKLDFWLEASINVVGCHVNT